MELITPGKKFLVFIFLDQFRGRHNTHHNDIQPNDTQHNDIKQSNK